MKNLAFTVFTPAHNSARTLSRVYSSLASQTFKDFEWVVVDDGSTDNTRSLVETWMHEADFPIRYFWQENAHKKTAFNRGVKEARGELFLNADDDDTFLPEALDIFYRTWMSIPATVRNEFTGVCGLCVNENGRLVGDSFPRHVLDSDYLEVRYHYGVLGEKWGFNRTDILRQYPFPQDIQGCVPEGVIWSAIARRYKTRFVNEIVRIYHYSPGSLSNARDFLSISRNAEGHALWAREVLTNELSWFRCSPVWFLHMAANYTRFHSHLHKKGEKTRFSLSGLAPKLLVGLVYPLGKFLYRLDLSR